MGNRSTSQVVLTAALVLIAAVGVYSASPSGTSALPVDLPAEEVRLNTSLGALGAQDLFPTALDFASRTGARCST